MVLKIIIATVVVAIISLPALTLVRNYIKARQIGLPILLSPADPLNPFWALLVPVLRPLLIRLPFRLGEWVDFLKFGWVYSDRNRLHRELGPAFVIVNPASLVVILGDELAIEDVLSRRKDYIKPPSIYGSLDLFGPNVDSVNGDVWQRHRKITTPPFNERNSNLVWKESLKQARGMLKSWVAAGKSGISNTRDDTMVLALHVLTAAGFGKSYDFEDATSTITKGHKITFGDALHTVLTRFVIVLLTSSLNLSWGPVAKILPQSLTSVQSAIAEFKQYLVEMVAEERASVGKKTDDQDNLMSALLRASDLRDAQGDGRSTLSEDEIYGNLFIYSFAGHDTTAGTLAYAMALLARDNKIQSWIKEEINSVIGREQDETWDYEKSFPQLKRCMAIMYETLRIYGPVVVLPKSTGNSSQIFTMQGTEYVIPPDTFVMTNLVAAHLSPETWGPDPYVWRPERWIIKDHKSGTESLLQPPPGTYLPWASGPRICPGKKFAQVEFVAVIARLFQHHRVMPALRDGQTFEEASKMILETVEDSEVTMTLGMKHPKKVRLRWEVDV